MKKIILSFGVIFALSLNLFALSNDIKFDMLKTKLAQQLKSDDYKNALVTIGEIKTLGIKIPQSLNFFEAKAYCETGDKIKCYKRMESYVNATGKSGRYYKQAIGYLVKTESAYKAGLAKEKALQEKIRQKEIDRRFKIELQKEKAGEYRKLNHTVTSKVTGLMWTLPLPRKYSGNPYINTIKTNVYSSSAKSICRNLRLDGYSDWRLPNMTEFDTITRNQYTKNTIDWRKTWGSYFWVIGERIFPTYSSKKFYTTGYIYRLSTSFYNSNKHSTADIICVRYADEERFKKFINHKYIVTKHNGHKLMIEDTFKTGGRLYRNDIEITLSSARKYCKKLRLAGYSDWRVPTKQDIHYIPCSARKRFYFERSSYESFWYDTSELFGKDGGRLDLKKCKYYGTRWNNEKHYVRCIRDVN